MNPFKYARHFVVNRAVNAARSAMDSRQEIPEELDEHLRRECVSITATPDGRNYLLRQTQCKTMVKIRKQRNPIRGEEYRVTTSDGLHVGYLSNENFLRAGLSTRGEVETEVYGPIWAGRDYGMMYIPITAEAMERKKLNTWISVSSNNYFASGEVHEIDGEILQSNTGKGKQQYIISAGSARICKITPRMACYDAVAERSGMRLRLVVSERRDGEHGEYWRVGLYF